MRWVESLVSNIIVSDVRSHPNPNMLSALYKLIARQPLTKPEVAWLLRMAEHNPIDVLDDIDMIEMQDWFKEHYDIEISYL